MLPKDTVESMLRVFTQPKKNITLSTPRTNADLQALHLDIKARLSNAVQHQDDAKEAIACQEILASAGLIMEGLKQGFGLSKFTMISRI